ncbi:7-methylguanosine phosphate-specific 5'-nucleotidase [Agrilus planipennis]|uniref:5'-nucleotidase n=1 Tax=Agrilus planipennis TaxID=224129 RepID=A0A1W4XW98_AGRPL|nr:7-methylguanosine phosphate-specific 5'-nucleotidase [Agrilus planipennis]
MFPDYIANIEELQAPHVYIKNTDRLNNIIHQLVQGGNEGLQIVSDFDKTITKQHENGKNHLSSFGMFSKCKSLPKDYFENDRALTAKYLPIEHDPVMPLEEKRKYMVEWWRQSENTLKGLKITPEEIDNVVNEVGPSLRDGSKEMFDDLYKSNVPVLVFSAGLGDCVVSTLKHHNVLYPNVKVVSNFLKITDGVVQGFDGPTIHILNKNEFALKGTKYYDMVKDRGNVILMGDHTGDARMAEGVPHQKAILKIGFLYDLAEENLENYKETFDIVLLDDQTMNVVRAILKLIL